MGTAKALLSPPSYAITFAHRTLKDKTGLKVPFVEIRHKTNLLGNKLAQKIKKSVEELPPDERFRKLVRWCGAANHLDSRTVRTGYGFDPEQIKAFLTSQFRTGLGIDMTDDFLQIARNSKQVLFIHDNVGEIVFDTLLIEELKKWVVG